MTAIVGPVLHRPLLFCASTSRAFSSSARRPAVDFLLYPEPKGDSELPYHDEDEEGLEDENVSWLRVFPVAR